METWIIVSSILSTCGGLVALKWRINLHRHKYDRSMALIESAQYLGTDHDVEVAADAAARILARLEREPLYKKIAARVLKRSRRRRIKPPRSGDGPPGVPSS